MFTGIVQHVGTVAAVRPSPAGIRLEVDPAGWEHRPGAGDSIAVNGCCLTLASSLTGPSHVLSFDVVPQTLALTTLGAWAPGRRVNLEHAATPATLLGGHLVQGHVDGVGRVLANGAVPGGNGWRLRVEYPASLAGAMVPQGSICIDGVSLTIASLDPASNAAEIALIPTTLDRTTLGRLLPGDAVNVEGDVIAKQVAALYERAKRP